jgi:hypothetical protein
MRLGTRPTRLAGRKGAMGLALRRSRSSTASFAAICIAPTRLAFGWTKKKPDAEAPVGIMASGELTPASLSVHFAPDAPTARPQKRNRKWNRKWKKPTTTTTTTARIVRLAAQLANKDQSGISLLTSTTAFVDSTAMRRHSWGRVTSIISMGRRIARAAQLRRRRRRLARMFARRASKHLGVLLLTS